MLKKISTSLFLLIYLSVSALSFADEVALEIVTEASSVIETLAEPAEKNVVTEQISEEIISDSPIVEEVFLLEEDTSTTTEGGAVEDTAEPIPEEILPLEEVQSENVAEPITEESVIGPLNTAPEEIMEEVLLEEIPITEVPMVVEVEKNSIFTPPGPEPEPWQPVVREDPTTESNTPVGDTETQSDPAFLAENSVFVRRMIENVVVDPTAKHSCKVDVFRTDISDTAAFTLSVKFYGISMLAEYDAEIGGLPNGIDVRFAKNNDYIYDFRGKETTLELLVNNQDGSLTGDFTIPIIYTHKGKKESTVICQLNIVNEEEEVIPVPIIAPIVDPVQDMVEEILNVVISEPEPVIETPVIVEEILDVVTTPAPEIIPEIPVIPETPLEIAVPEAETPPILPLADDIIVPPVITDYGPVISESETPPVSIDKPAIAHSVVENSPMSESAPILSPDVSSI